MLTENLCQATPKVVRVFWQKLSLQCCQQLLPQLKHMVDGFYQKGILDPNSHFPMFLSVEPIAAVGDNMFKLFCQVHVKLFDCIYIAKQYA